MARSSDKHKILYVTKRQEWRAWLKRHYKSETEVWLIYYKKHSGRPRIAYNDAVEEALCFGWIDSTIRTIDADSFTLEILDAEPQESILTGEQGEAEGLSQAGEGRQRSAGYLGGPLGGGGVRDSAGHPQGAQSQPGGLEELPRFFASVHSDRIAFIDAVRERDRRSSRSDYENFIQMTEKNKQFGFGGIEKHY